ncbi:transposase [Lentibacillus cibarius]|uniref:Transposase n=1 Tax=Lentibacillus cibarius TaxID=2583219 RepID=A0A549YFM7_9BACI|nr:transposase [Lentibacillus cibarius]TRM10648.1 transposase [Lentibacillus cibarius]
MGRPRRDWHANGYYHITMRGNNRQNIFTDHMDVNEYYRILTSVYGKFPFEVHAYCIMTNHVHLLLRSPHVSLGILMAQINKRYSDYYRRRHDFVGQIYQNRYYSKEVPLPTGMLQVSAYIHRNPIETNVPMVSQLQLYPYSSFPLYYYQRKSPHPFVRLDVLPSLVPAGTEYATWCQVPGT